MILQATAQLQDILQAVGLQPEHSARLARHSRWHALAADAPLPQMGPNAWVVQGSVQVLHNNLVLDTLLAGTPIPAHACRYALQASGAGAVVAEISESIESTPPVSVAGTTSAPTATPAPPLEACPKARPLDTLRTLQQLVLQRLGNRWPFLALAALTLQALAWAQPIAMGFAIDEVLISEHRHAWLLCLIVAGIAAALRYVLQRAAHHTLFVQTPEDVVPRGLAYAAWMQGCACGVSVLFVALINGRIASVMLAGMLVQMVVLIRALPEQKLAAEISATRRLQRAALLKESLHHAEALMIQGLVPTLADEAARWDAPEREPLAAVGPRVATLVASLSHLAVLITGATLSQFHGMSVGMLMAAIVINLQAHHDVRAVLAHAGELLRPTRGPDERRASHIQANSLHAALQPGRRLALTGTHSALRARYLRAVHALCRDTSVLSITPHGALPAGTLRYAVARHTRASTADVLRALAWAGAQTLMFQGMDTLLVADDPRLCAMDKLRLQVAHALCAEPDVLLLDGVLDACGTSQAKALFVNLSRGLPRSCVLVSTQRADLVALCHQQIHIVDPEA